MKTVLTVVALSFVSLTFASCSVHGGASCSRLSDELCDICPKNDFQSTFCTCLSEGTLTASDMPDYDAYTNDEAARECSEIRYGIKYPGLQSAASCKADLEFIREWNVDACEDLGWAGN